MAGHSSMVSLLLMVIILATMAFTTKSQPPMAMVPALAPASALPPSKVFSLALFFLNISQPELLPTPPMQVPPPPPTPRSIPPPPPSPIMEPPEEDSPPLEAPSPSDDSDGNINDNPQPSPPLPPDEGTDPLPDPILAPNPPPIPSPSPPPPVTDPEEDATPMPPSEE